MKFVYDTGLARKVFQNVRLLGTWDAAGKHSSEWSECPMREVSAPDGAIVFEAEVNLAPSEVGKEFSWRVVLDGPLGLDREGVVTEQGEHGAQHCTFQLQRGVGEQRYYLTH